MSDLIGPAVLGPLLAGPILAGFASAATLFLLAAGLTLVFGVCRVVNFAHGSLAMLGAYLAWSIVPLMPPRLFGIAPLGFTLGAVLAALMVAGLGALIERMVIRRLYAAPELLALLATFALVLIAADLIQYLWGAEDLVLPRPAWQRGAVLLGQTRVPLWDLVLITVGCLTGLSLAWLLRYTSLGRALRATAENREMAAALGVRQGPLATAIFALGAGLAGLAGALILPNGSASLNMDAPLVVDAFVVVVVGGLGSLGGAALASLLIGELQSFGALWLPQSSLVIAFAAMALVLALRPHGLLGRALAPRQAAAERPLRLRPAGPIMRWLFLVALLLAATAPWLVGSYGLSILTEAAIAILFAASLQLAMGIGGMPSFGHAAWFLLGAYAVGGMMHTGLPPLLSLAAGLVFALLIPGAIALALGAAIIRREGVVLAMLSLAFAQIVWAGAIQWVGLTGGDNGMLGIRAGLGSAGTWWLTLAMGLGGALLLRRVIFARLGSAVRASRDAPIRAAALGLPVAALRLAAFTLSGAVAGLAGGLFAQAKGAVFPTYGAIPHSVDALVMVLLGGVQAASGPILGGLAYTGLYDLLLRAVPLWRLALGLLILTLVLALPNGLAGPGVKEGRRP